MGQALQLLHLPHKQTFACESNGALRKMIPVVFAVGRCHHNVFSAKRTCETATMMHEAGCPCQSFAPQGLHKGLQDGNGQVGLAVIDWILKNKAATFIFDNVVNFVTRHKDSFRVLMNKLKKGNIYDVHARVVKRLKLRLASNATQSLRHWHLKGCPATAICMAQNVQQATATSSVLRP